MGSPLFMAVAFSLAGIWILLMALPGLRHPPIDSGTRTCPSCKSMNTLQETLCQTCGKTLDERPA